MSANVTIAKLNTLVTANAAQFVTELGKAEKASVHFGEFAKKGLEAFGIGLGIAGVIEFGKSVIELSSNITDLSKASGFSTDALQDISNIAALSGVKMEEVAKSAERLRNKLQDAADGAVPVREELRKLNLDFAGLQSLAPEDQWRVISTAIVEAKDQQQAYNIASDLFGEKIGPKLREVFEELSKGMKNVADLNKGLKIDKQTLKSLDDAGDALGRAWTFVKVLGAKGLNGALGFGSDAGSGLNQLSEFLTGTKLTEIPKLFGYQSSDDVTRAFNADDGTTKNGLHFGISKEDAAKTLASAMADGAAEFNRKQLDLLLSKDNSVTTDSLRARVFRDNERTPAKIDIPQMDTDRLARIGLLTGVGVTKGSEEKKQTNLLDGIKKELMTLNTKTFNKPPTWQ